MTISIGIKEDYSAAVALDLSGILADEFVLYTKTLNAHWNIEGPDFHTKHLFFGDQYEQLGALVDDVAERIRSIGHYAPATLKSFLQLTHLTEMSRENNDSNGYIKGLLEDHERIILNLRSKIDSFMNNYHDSGSSDFITGLMETHEKMAWMLRAHLK